MSQYSPSDFLSGGAAPLGSARQQPACPPTRGKRLRRRGPRSQLARLRRSVPKHRRSLPGMSPGEAGDGMPVHNISCASQRPCIDVFDEQDIRPHPRPAPGWLFFLNEIMLDAMEFVCSLSSVSKYKHRPYQYTCNIAWACMVAMKCGRIE